MELKRRPRWRLTQTSEGARSSAGDSPVDPRQAAALGGAMAREREARGVSPEQVAEVMGVSVADVVALETGTAPGGQRGLAQAFVAYRRAVNNVLDSRRG